MIATIEFFLILILLIIAVWFAWRYYDLRKRINQYAQAIRNQNIFSGNLKELENLASIVSSLQSILSFGGVQGGLVASQLNAAMNDVVSDVHYFKGQYKKFRDVTSFPDERIFVITHDRMFPEIRMIYNPNYHIGIEEEQEISFNVFPNPAENILFIKGNKEIDFC